MSVERYFSKYEKKKKKNWETKAPGLQSLYIVW